MAPARLVDRSAALAALAALGLAGAGCSLILDFSPSAIPADAAIDAPYSPEECEYKEPNNTASEAAVIAPTDVGPAAICLGDPEDHDFYKFTVPAGTTKVTARIAFLHSLGDLDLRLLDATGIAVIAQSRGVSDNESLTCPAASPACPTLMPGTYLLEVFPSKPSAGNRYDISLTLTP